MKKILILTLLFGLFLTSCQDDDDNNPSNNNDNYSIEFQSYDQDVSGTIMQSEVKIHAKIENTSDEDITIKVTMIPALSNGHSAAVCTSGFCYAATTEMFEAEFELDDGEVSDDDDFIAYVYPNLMDGMSQSVTGSGSVEFKFDILDDEGNVIEGKTKTFTVNYKIKDLI